MVHNFILSHYVRFHFTTLLYLQFMILQTGTRSKYCVKHRFVKKTGKSKYLATTLQTLKYYLYVYVYSPIKATLHARHTETDRNRQ